MSEGELIRLLMVVYPPPRSHIFHIFLKMYCHLSTSMYIMEMYLKSFMAHVK